jgi:hypothetical protein
MPEKIIVLLPDGVSLRNFAYTSFYQLGKAKGYEVIFWNQTPFDLDELGFKQIKTRIVKPHWFTNILKASCIRVELRLFENRDNDKVYRSYLFKRYKNGLKGFFKYIMIVFYSKIYQSENGLLKLRKRIINQERKTEYYKQCHELLKQEAPSFLLCTSQRSVTSISPLTASRDLAIPNATFIFSWDNVPKATTVVSADNYFVWSEHMKQELLHYQRYISADHIFVTGTPQFEPHFDAHRIMSKKKFYTKLGLDLSKKYICFSGDDLTTSPKDELYLRDVAMAVRSLNIKGHKIGLIFRRCPVDFSDRYDRYLKEFVDVIVAIPPLWKKIGEQWNMVLPMAEDLDLLVNIAQHTDLVINLASSMVFDFATFGKPCAYMNYNYLNEQNKATAGVYLYDFVHFRSMPSKQAVFWLDHPNNLENDIAFLLKENEETVSQGRKWLKKINLHPADNASQRILETLTYIVAKH